MDYINQFLKIISVKDKFIFLLIGLLMGGTYLLNFWIPLTQKDFINTAIAKKELLNNSFYLLIIFYISSFLLSLLHSVLYGLYHNYLQNKLTVFFYEKIIRMKKALIKKRGVGHYFDCLVGDLDQALYILSPSLFSFIFSLIQTAFIFVIIWKWSSSIAIIFIGALFLSIATSLISSKFEKKYWSEIRNSSTAVSSFAIDSFMNNQIINFTQTISKFCGAFKEKYLSQTKVQDKNSIRYSLSESILVLISTFSSFVVIIFAINLVIQGEMNYGELLAIISYYQMLFHPVDNFFELISTYFNTNVSIQRILDIDESSFTENNLNYLPSIARVTDFKLKNITLTYYDKQQDKERIILQNGKFEIKNNQRVGLVGLSGEGKSSLIKLFEKDLTNLKEGLVTIGDANINDFSQSYYYSRISILPQEIEIFNNNLEFNLTLGKEKITKDEAKKLTQELTQDFAAILAKIKSIIGQNQNVIKKLNLLYQENLKYYETLSVHQLIFKNDSQIKNFKNLKMDDSKLVTFLVNYYLESEYYLDEDLQNICKLLDLEKLQARNLGESGSFISGGEKQRIGLARFLLKKDYDFFIIDEPLTSLDAKNEEIILKILRESIQNKTGLVISHRFNILNALVSYFYVINEGSVREEGNHQELLENKGLYRELYDSYKKNINFEEELC